jgi:hypothetical protein
VVVDVDEVVAVVVVAGAAVIGGPRFGTVAAYDRSPTVSRMASGPGAVIVAVNRKWSASVVVRTSTARTMAPHSPGAGSGDVVQSNTASNHAAAGDLNATEQAALQEQAGPGSGGGQHQTADVANATGRRAGAAVYNGQFNISAPVSVFSPGAGSGSVTQSNSATNAAAAGNANATFQGAEQGQAASGHDEKSSGQQQYASLFNRTRQSAKSNVYNVQDNIYAPVTIGGVGAGSGAVHQSNTASNSASAFNLNRLFQFLFQAAGIHVFRF